MIYVKNYPFHKDENVINSKILLIGRTYAAAIERRKKFLNIIGDDFYLKIVGPKIINSKIDNWIDECKNSSDFSTIIKTHKKVSDLFQEISGLNKRSLASKYLHFHLPNLFFIYDSRAYLAINELIKEFQIKKSEYLIKKEELNFADIEYAKFCKKCICVIDKINIKLTPRQLDDILIEIANKKLRNK